MTKVSKPPYACMIFVCTNTRKDGRVACANPGRGGDLLCAQGPNLMVWPEGLWYKGATEADLPEIITKHLKPLQKGA